MGTETVWKWRPEKELRTGPVGLGAPSSAPGGGTAALARSYQPRNAPWARAWVSASQDSGQAWDKLPYISYGNCSFGGTGDLCTELYSQPTFLKNYFWDRVSLSGWDTQVGLEPVVLPPRPPSVLEVQPCATMVSWLCIYSWVSLDSTPTSSVCASANLLVMVCFPNYLGFS